MQKAYSFFSDEADIRAELKKVNQQLAEIKELLAKRQSSMPNNHNFTAPNFKLEFASNASAQELRQAIESAIDDICLRNIETNNRHYLRVFIQRMVDKFNAFVAENCNQPADFYTTKDIDTKLAEFGLLEHK